MTTPGMDDDKVPDGAYVPGTGFGQENRHLDSVEKGKNFLHADVHGAFGGLDNLLLDLVNGLIGGAVALVKGAVDVVTGAIKGVFDFIGGLFSSVRDDTYVVDKARADAELAISENMLSTTEHLDEALRFGGAYSTYPAYNFEWGENHAHVLPMDEPMNLAAGTSWQYPNTYLDDHYTEHTGTSEMFPNTSTWRGRLAKGAGTVMIEEPGLWLVFFQAAVLQGPRATDNPVDVWCYATPSDSPYLPVGAPGYGYDGTVNPGNMSMLHRRTGYSESRSISEVYNFARAGSYLHHRDGKFGGGNTVFGLLPLYLPTGGWKLSTSCTAFRHFGGGTMSTYLVAHKVNTQTIRDDIDEIQQKIASDLPGEQSQLSLTEADIQSLVDQIEGIEVPEDE